MKFTGKVIHGAGRGKGLGFPTLNLFLNSGESDSAGVIDLEFGVYAVWVSDKLPGVMSYGPRPTFHESQPVAEIFLLETPSSSLPTYGDTLVVEAMVRLRSIQEFPSPDALIAQIQKDVEFAKNILK